MPVRDICIQHFLHASQYLFGLLQEFHLFAARKIEAFVDSTLNKNSRIPYDALNDPHLVDYYERKFGALDIPVSIVLHFMLHQKVCAITQCIRSSVNYMLILSDGLCYLGLLIVPGGI